MFSHFEIKYLRCFMTRTWCSTWVKLWLTTKIVMSSTGTLQLPNTGRCPLIFVWSAGFFKTWMDWSDKDYMAPCTLTKSFYMYFAITNLHICAQYFRLYFNWISGHKGQKESRSPSWHWQAKTYRQTDNSGTLIINT